MSILVCQFPMGLELQSSQIISGQTTENKFLNPSRWDETLISSDKNEVQVISVAMVWVECQVLSVQCSKITIFFTCLVSKQLVEIFTNNVIFFKQSQADFSFCVINSLILKLCQYSEVSLILCISLWSWSLSKLSSSHLCRQQSPLVKTQAKKKIYLQRSAFLYSSGIKTFFFTSKRMTMSLRTGVIYPMI